MEEPWTDQQSFNMDVFHSILMEGNLLNILPPFSWLERVTER